MAVLSTWVERFLVPLDDPGSRLFHMNILIAALLVAGWVFAISGQGARWSTFRRLVLRKKYWWNHSTRLDYKIYIFNSLLKVFLLVPFLDWSFHIARFTAQRLERWNGDFLGFTPSYPALLLFTVAAFVWDDFLRFGQHVLMHKVPWLWRIHCVHHSARILTPVTLYRNHPLESAIATVRNSLSLGVATGMFIFIFESRFSVLTLFGVNALGFLFNLAGANLRHSHIPLSFGRRIETVLISPFQHQIHHSRHPRHFNKNFGVSLALWDRLFGSLVYSREASRIRVGLNRRQGGLWRLLLLR
ncbi:MAG: sterol desaturase family protein [Bdellovibrionales bacterium]|nr:sterol desaturase family protein [Bdellovibrionales bacterium]